MYDYYIKQLKKYFSNDIQDYLNKDQDKLSEGRQYNFYFVTTVTFIGIT